MIEGLCARARWAWALSAAVAALLACGMTAQAASAKRVRVAITATPQNIVPIVAKDRGIFEKYGIDAQVTSNTASGNFLPSIGKQYEVVVATLADVLLYAGKGGDPLVLNTSVVETKKTAQPNLIVQKGINSLKQLKGKTICSISVGNGQQWVSAFIALQKAGMNPRKDVKFVVSPAPTMLDYLRSGRCDAALAIQPYITQMRAAGYGGLTNTLLSVAKNAPSAMYVTRARLVKKDPKTFRNFQKAFTEAANWCKANTGDCAEEITKAFGTSAATARATPFNQITPKAKNSWITDWIKPMKRVGLIKKSRVSATRSYVVK